MVVHVCKQEPFTLKRNSCLLAAVYNAIIEGQGNRFLMLIMFLIAVAKFL